MKAVKGYSKDYYKKECAQEGGEAFEFSSMDQAAEHLANMGGYTLEAARAGIENDTNCDWIYFEDGSVLFRYYGRGYSTNYINQNLRKQ